MATIDSNLVLKQGQKLKDALVPTTDTARYTYLMDLFVRNGIPSLFVGPTGTGKSVYIKDYLMNQVDKEVYKPQFLNFSAQTTANQTQNLILGKLDKRRKGIFGPRMGTKSVFFVDDLNMPALEQYGAQPPIELLRQLLDHALWYDLKDTTAMSLVDVQIIGAMGPPGGGRNPVTSRFLRHMSVVGLTEFDDDTMVRIFSTVVARAFKDGQFPMEIQGMGQQIVQATAHVYNESIKSLLPTPAKSHYTFNLRDFARVVNGVLLIKGKRSGDKNKMCRLWAHEVFRVYYDRLIDDDDRGWLFNLVKDVTKSHFKLSFDAVFAGLATSGKTATESDFKSLLFGDFMEPDSAEKLYDEVTDLDKFKAVVTECLEEYNNINKTPMDLVVFRYVLEHLVRICRVLKQDGGHALLVGVGGSGRQSMTRLAAHICDYTLFQPEITKQYGEEEWKEDIKSVLRKAGGGQPTVFLLNDTQIKEESFLEDVDALLNSGEVANIFPPDEKSEVCELVRPAAQEENPDADFSPLALYTFFVSRCKDNLHLILGMSPIGNTFRNRLRMFPSLVNCCTIDWFQVSCQRVPNYLLICAL